MASRAPSKSAKKAKTPAGKARTSPTTAARAKASQPPRTGSPAGSPERLARPGRPLPIPRAMPAVDDDDVLMAHGAGGGAGFGRCGGRLLGSRLEQTLCDRLSNAGVAHSHSPRHFEVRLADSQVGAYAPMVVLRGRGREGKSVVIEAAEEQESPILRKVVAFRSQYGQEFYVILVAPDDVLDEVPVAAFDESCSASSVGTLISRLAE